MELGLAYLAASLLSGTCCHQIETNKQKPSAEFRSTEVAFVPSGLFKRQEVLALLHLPGKREWGQTEFHKLCFFFSLGC